MTWCQADACILGTTHLGFDVFQMVFGGFPDTTDMRLPAFG
jgi:hypothetical protein